MENRKSNSKLFRGTEGTQKFDVPIGLSGCFEKVRIKGGTGEGGWERRYYEFKKYKK